MVAAALVKSKMVGIVLLVMTLPQQLLFHQLLLLIHALNNVEMNMISAISDVMTVTTLLMMVAMLIAV
jgi:hypothetical protein